MREEKLARIAPEREGKGADGGGVSAEKRIRRGTQRKGEGKGRETRIG